MHRNAMRAHFLFGCEFGPIDRPPSWFEGLISCLGFCSIELIVLMHFPVSVVFHYQNLSESVLCVDSRSNSNACGGFLLPLFAETMAKVSVLV